MTGIDLSEELIALAGAAERERPLGVSYKTHSFTDLAGIVPHSFDCALSTLALMDGPDLAGAMREAHRVLQPGGRLPFSKTHPCFATPAIKWLRSEDGAFERLRAGRYIDAETFVEEWKFRGRHGSDDAAPFTVPAFPLELSDHVDALAGAGFRILRFGVPRPDRKLAKERMRLANWYEHASFILLVDVEKD